MTNDLQKKNVDLNAADIVDTAERIFVFLLEMSAGLPSGFHHEFTCHLELGEFKLPSHALRHPAPPKIYLPTGRAGFRMYACSVNFKHCPKCYPSVLFDNNSKGLVVFYFSSKWFSSSEEQPTFPSSLGTQHEYVLSSLGSRSPLYSSKGAPSTSIKALKLR